MHNSTWYKYANEQKGGPVSSNATSNSHSAFQIIAGAIIASLFAFGLLLAIPANAAYAAEPNYNLYKPVLQDEYESTVGVRAGMCKYSVFDIDGDGTAELIVRSWYQGNVGASWTSIYTISGGRTVQIGKLDNAEYYGFYAKGSALYYAFTPPASASKRAGRVTKSGDSVSVSSSSTGENVISYIQSVGASRLAEANYDNYTLLPGWKKDSTGWWYRDTNGGYPANAWRKVGGKWYHFDSAGYMQTGWQKVGGTWYYLGTDGKMTTGWQKVGGKWYYLGTDGVMRTGWQKVSGTWYYLNADGTMATNAWKKDSKGWCYLGANGKLATNTFAKDSKGWCWLGSDGYWVASKWVQNGDAWYYIKSDHYRAESEWVKSGSYWYYLQDDGTMATGTIQIGSKTYSFDDKGHWLPDSQVSSTGSSTKLMGGTIAA